MTEGSNVPFSPIALVGTITLLAAYLLAAWCVAAGIAGNARRSRRLVSSSVYGLYGFCALIGLSAALMIYAFVTHDYSIKYVAHTSDTTMPTIYKVTSFWGGLDGSLLFWVLVLSLFSAIAIRANAKRHRDMIGFVVATIMVVQVFFLSLLIFTKNPFSTFLTQPPVDGEGLNPLLQNYWMVIHPPSLYTGFVAATIPFAFGIGALASGRLDDMWLGSVRVWMLICFFFLSFGLILGGRWAYEELGWGGYWAWDPVENAGLMPWFTATAFLHSAIIQEQRGQMKIWNLMLVIVTFFLTIFGTFMTRSGAVQSVHAFGEDNVLALQFIVFMAVILIVSIGLVVYRANKLSTRTEFESFFSREFAFLVNNWILLACAFFVLFATMFPTISEALDGTRVSVGPEFFNKWMTPLALTLLVLAGGAPLLAWRKTTRERLYNQFVIPVACAAGTVLLLGVLEPVTWHRSPIFSDGIKLPISLINFGIVAFVAGSIGQEFVRGVMVRRRQTGSDPLSSLLGLMLSKRRKYGGYLIHLGVAVLFVGFAGKAYDRMADRSVDVSRMGELAAKKQDLKAKAASDPKAAAALKELDQQDPNAIPPPNDPAWFEFSGYRFLYDQLIQTSDDHKIAITAQVRIFQGTGADAHLIGTVYPGKSDYQKQDQQALSDVAIKVRFGEDVYVVLDGYDLDAQKASFRVFINPLILWVWIGFLVLAAGTFVCLIPQRVVDWLSPGGGRGGTPLGRAADIGILVVLALGLTAGVGHAAPQAAGAEHVPAGQGMGDSGTGYAGQNRPTNETAERAMKEINCTCGCPRESIFTCPCATAAKLRAQINGMVTNYDLTKADQREKAYNDVLNQFVADYGGEQVLATPRSSASWMLPSLAVVGALALLIVAGRRWVVRGRATAISHEVGVIGVDDEAYADKLDDELRDTD